MMPILRRISVLFVLGALALPAAAQDLLPGSFAGWSGGALSRFAPANFGQVSPALAPILLECGALSVETRAYTRGTDRLSVTLYQMRDPTGAYCLRTFPREDPMDEGNMGQYVAAYPGRLSTSKGSIMLETTGEELERFQGTLRDLMDHIRPKPQPGPLPTVGHYLPAKGKIGFSFYVGGPVALGRVLPLAEGDWLGFSDGAEAEMARYLVRGQLVKLLVVTYPTQQVAARRMEEMEKRFATGTVNGKPVALRRSVSLIAIATGGSSRDAIEELLRSVQYESQVTWNEPGYSATDPSVPEIILGAIFGTGNILMLAFFSGIAFGFIRVAVKRYLPGRVFDRPAAVEIIQLGLTSKPIQAKDFYL
jgi:hypothetical protein